MADLDKLLYQKEKIQKHVPDIENITQDVKDKLDILDKKIANLCNHSIVNDYIDTMFPYREGILISYCEYCELSKKVIDLYKN